MTSSRRNNKDREPAARRGYERFAYYEDRELDEMNLKLDSRGPSRNRINERGYNTENRRRAGGFRAHDLENERRMKISSWSSGRDEWNCTECQTWNLISRTSCIRCGRLQPRGRIEASDHGATTVDEFGRNAALSGRQSGGPHWPPPFDRRSATYVFDARSGMFYHASTQFFFDPKTKLYYGNREQKYYSFSKGESPPFKEFKAEVNSEENADFVKVESKPKIAISLKTKVLASSGTETEQQKEAANSRDVGAYRVKDEHALNIDRWFERGREIKGKEQIVRTILGKPVCLLCKRKFANLECMERHESHSELHTLKMSIYEKKRRKLNEQTETTNYRDRAFERRLLHDSDDIQLVEKAIEKSHMQSSVRPQHDLGEQNVGNKMLQRLGWNGGATLGRHGRTESPDGALQKDWDRIELLARSAKR